MVVAAVVEQAARVAVAVSVVVGLVTGLLWRHDGPGSDAKKKLGTHSASCSKRDRRFMVPPSPLALLLPGATREDGARSPPLLAAVDSISRRFAAIHTLEDAIPSTLPSRRIRIDISLKGGASSSWCCLRSVKHQIKKIIFHGI